MAEYMEREALLDDLDAAMKKSGMGYVVGQTMKRYIKRVPAADVTPVVHAEWIPSPDGINPIKCRRCGTVAPYRMELDFNHDIGLYPYKSNYCPNCGAKMDGGKHGN